MSRPPSFMPARGKSPYLLARNPIYRAMAKKPMTAITQTDVYLPAQLAFKAALEGTVTASDRDDLAVMCNIIMILAEKHCTQADLDDAIAAQHAINRADKRALDGERWHLDTEGCKAIIQALSTHEQQVSQLGQVEVTDAVLTMNQRRLKGQSFKLGAQQ
jgi:hypothetical protein